MAVFNYVESKQLSRIAVAEAFASLTPYQALILWLRYIHTEKEIAEMLEVRQQTVQVLLKRIHKKVSVFLHW